MPTPSKVYYAKAVKSFNIQNGVGDIMVLNPGDTLSLQALPVSPVGSGSQTQILIEIKSGNQNIHVWIYGTIPQAIASQKELIAMKKLSGNSASNTFHNIFGIGEGNNYGCGPRPLLAKNRGPWDECVKRAQEIEATKAQTESEIVQAIATPTQKSGTSPFAILGIVLGVAAVVGTLGYFAYQKFGK